MTHEDILVEKLENEGAEQLIRSAVEKSGFTLAQLNEQASEGRFESETARRTWFMISSLVEAA